MKQSILILTIFVAIGCNQTNQKGEKAVAKEHSPTSELSIQERADSLKNAGYNVFTYKEGDTTFLMQEYYMVFLKKGENRNQDSATTAQLQKAHLAHLTHMAEAGYASLIGPFGDDGEIRGIVVFATKTQKMADSLAHLDPMVKAGRLKVEVHPWWTAKGGKLP